VDLKTETSTDSKTMELGLFDSGQLVDFKLINREKMERRLTITDEAQLATTKAITNGGVRCKFVVLVFKLRLVTWDKDALRIPATGYSQTLCASAGTV
jgi:hypothetical protein